jgi:hypothetical protein
MWFEVFVSGALGLIANVLWDIRREVHLFRVQSEFNHSQIKALMPDD